MAVLRKGAIFDKRGYPVAVQSQTAARKARYDWGKRGHRARALFSSPEAARLCLRRKHVLDWALEGVADHPLCTVSWELGGVLGAQLTEIFRVFSVNLIPP